MQLSDWGALPSQLLKHAFEMQERPLDNCAAACACKVWRTVANAAHIGTLQLRAQHACQAKVWKAFLRTRSSTIGHLELIGNRHADSEDWPSLPHAENPLTSIPLACDRLTANDCFAKDIHHFTDQSAQLKRLCLVLGPLFLYKDSAAISSLNHLAMLQSLELELQSYTTKTLVSYLCRCPDQLESFVLDAGRYPYDLEISLVQAALTTRLASLKNLELASFSITAPQNSITCLTNLTSLSLCKTKIWPDDGPWDFRILKLLDLTYSAWDCTLLTFAGGSSLSVLKTVGCSLFNKDIVMDIPMVHELHTAHLKADVHTPRMYFQQTDSTRSDKVLGNVINSVWAGYLVSVKLTMCPSVCTNAHVSHAMGEVLCL